jgi:competence protein CoiA
MFRGLNIETGVVIGSDDNKELIKELTQKELIVCGKCKTTLLFRYCTKKLSHFYHKNKCNDPYFDSETEEHFSVMIMLKNRLEGLYTDATVQLEVELPGTKQYSDVVVVHPTGESLAFQIQF